MSIYLFIAFCYAWITFFRILNNRFWHLPGTISYMIFGMLLSVFLVLTKNIIPDFSANAIVLISSINFSQILMEGMLGLLLFAGAIHVDYKTLWNDKLEVGILASFGVVISTFITGFLVYYCFNSFLDTYIPILPCLVFGALISPTDPISVLGIIRRLGVSRQLQVRISGESLFNDGVGVVMFTTLVSLAIGVKGHLTTGIITWHFIKETIFGAIYGAMLGYLATVCLRYIKEEKDKMNFTLSVVSLGYGVAYYLGISGLIAIVFAGLVIGNSDKEYVAGNFDHTWKSIDQHLTTILFVLMGLVIIHIDWQTVYFCAGLCAICIVLFSRVISVGLPAILLHNIDWLSYKVLVWGGLRGGISIALALSLHPDLPGKEVFLTATYMVVMFATIVQGLTVKYAVGKVEQTK